MKFGISVCAVVALISSVSAQTIADVLRTNANGGAQFPSIAKTAALAATHPEWGTPGTKTLIISTDAGLGTGTDPGFLFTDKIALKWETDAKYNVLHDTTENPICVYDNYNSGFTLHFRTGMEDLVALAVLPASNGYVYVLPGPLTKLKPVTTVLTKNANLGVGAFVNLIERAGLTNTVNNLQNVTFLVPNDTAIIAAQARINALTVPQLQYVIAHHILNVPLYSNIFNPTPYTNLNGVQLPATSGPNAAGEFSNSIGGAQLMIPNDLTTVNGPAQAIRSVIIPDNIPANAAFPSVLPGNQLTPATTAAATTAAATTAKAAATTAAGTSAATVTNAANTTPAAQKTGGSSVLKSSSLLLFASIMIVFLA
ncbi:hypothetical protein HK098_006380 [Nowakowskiella sp. JEL0407]|nr:hypothetical protein HK098_006380 [Nowakowskiella sp. JEL0407]